MQPMLNRLSRAADRAKQAARGDWYLPIEGIPRPDQMGVMRNFAYYLKECADKLKAGKSVPRGRIIVPSRLGKTVLETLMVASTGETATIFVPTLPILERTIAEWRTWLPNVPVGEYHAEKKTLVKDGVNVVMYHSGTALHKKDALPSEIRQSFFAFFDEGHESMTELRQEMVNSCVHPDAVRVALTATPDYNESKRLATAFPRLVHEMHLGEAISLHLLAPFKVKHVEVDLDASNVGIRNDEFDDAALGQTLSSGLMLEGVRHVRALPEYKHVATLITCSSVGQVMATVEHLRKHRVANEPTVLSFTGQDSIPDRENALKAFESGKCDTLVSVRMLLRGWDSPRCKLIIDEAPSLSAVLTKQKLMRPLTRVGNTPAHIVTVYPRLLRARPVMPEDVFGRGFEAGYLDIPEVTVTRKHGAPKNSKPTTTTRGVLANMTIRNGISSQDWTLNPQSPSEIVAVLRQHDRFVTSYLPRLQEFYFLTFRTLAFTGTGREFLRFCGIRCGVNEYAAFMLKIFPDRVGELFLEKAPSTKHRTKSVCLMDVGTQTEMSDDLESEEANPETCAIERQIDKKVENAFYLVLTERQRFVLTRRYRLDPDDNHFEPRTLEEVGEEMGLSRERVRGIEREACMRIREQGNISFESTFDEWLVKRYWPRTVNVQYCGQHRNGPIFTVSTEKDFTELFVGGNSLGIYYRLSIRPYGMLWFKQWTTTGEELPSTGDTVHIPGVRKLEPF